MEGGTKWLKTPLARNGLYAPVPTSSYIAPIGVSFPMQPSWCPTALEWTLPCQARPASERGLAGRIAPASPYLPTLASMTPLRISEVSPAYLVTSHKMASVTK